MAKFYEILDENLQAFIAEQKMFFTATAPIEGRINLSPKGMDTFHIFDNKRVAYLDMTGSGNETAAHLRENGRMTIMFCSFSHKPMILRLYGRGRVIRPHDEAWSELYPLFKPEPGARQIILLEIDSVQTSCGFAVPLYEFKSERETLRRWTENKKEEGLKAYRAQKNQVSIDGLPT
ncbi:MAG: pyridoxamine 5'-phosphate oxidase family protein [Ardenticatenaceae bacterium]